MHARLMSHALDFVLHLQLATLQLGDLRIIRGRVSERIRDFLVERPMPCLEFNKRLHGHVLKSPPPYWSSTPQVCPIRPVKSIARALCGARNPRFPPPPCGLNHEGVKRIINQSSGVGGALGPIFRKIGRSGAGFGLVPARPPDRFGNAASGIPPVTMDEEERELRAQLARLQQEHRDLDAAIEALADAPGADILQVQRLKKRKLFLRDRIAFIEDQLTPDIIA
jgi:hypothetical protein